MPQKFQLDRVHLQEVKRSSYEHTKKCADQLLLLGQVGSAPPPLISLSKRAQRPATAQISSVTNLDGSLCRLAGSDPRYVGPLLGAVNVD